MYRDLVLIRHLNSPSLFLFEAPCFSYLEPNDQVVCDTAIGEAAGFVVGSATFEKGSDTEKMLITACNATEPLKRIVKRAIFRDFVYTEPDNE